MFNRFHLTPSSLRERRRRVRMGEPDFGLLRSTLTANSVLKMLALAALIGGVVYGLTTYYLGYVTDQALRERMSIEYEALGLPLPAGLVSLEQKWNLIGQLEEAYDDEDVADVILRLDARARPIPNTAKDALVARRPRPPGSCSCAGCARQRL